MSANILITICARGGSKGIPGKNIKPIAGQPLIGYTINLAKMLSSKWNAKIALSTDNKEIRAVAAKYGILSDYNRPEFLSTDSAGKVDTIKDLMLYEETLSNQKFDYVLDLDVTSPLRTAEDVEEAFSILIANKNALNLFSVNKASRNPYFNMVEEKNDGFYKIVKSNSEGDIMTRQLAPNVFELNASFYWYRRTFFDLEMKSVISNKSLIYEMSHICFDLDHPLDFLFMEYLLVNKKLDFKL